MDSLLTAHYERTVEVILLKMSGHSQSSREWANAIFDSIRL
jgi:hypothetical protein